MGADLYIDLDAQTRDKGYFRDSYNSYNLLWQFDLSYWGDVAKRFCEDRSKLTVMGAQTWLKEMKNREPVFEKNLQDLLDRKNKVWDFETDFKTDKKTLKPNEDLTAEKRQELVKDYRKEYESLKAFLQTAIDLKTGAYCSL